MALVDWNEENWDRTMYDHVHTLMMLRRRSMALQTGDIRVQEQNGMVTVRRIAPMETVVAVINNTETEQTARISLPRSADEVFTGEQMLLENGEVTVTVPPMSARILVTNRMI